MKSKTINIIVGAIIFVLVFVVWKLNAYYKQEKSSLVENQIHQQTLNLKTTVSSQLTQLKNIISSYQGQIDESKINWVQLNPFFALVQVDISKGQYTLKNLFVKSGTSADNWSNDYIQKALSYSRFSNKDIHAQLFQNQLGDKFLALIFSGEKIQNSRQAVVLIGDAVYFQKFFDAQRSARGTNLLLTNDSVVVGHTQSEYIATKTQESQLNPQKYFLDKDQIRSSNLNILSYSPKLVKGDFLYIPLFVLVFIFGFAFILIGILLYALRPLQNENRKAEIFKKVFDEVQRKPNEQPAPAATTISVEEPPLVNAAEPNETKKETPLTSAIEVILRGVQKIKVTEIVDLALEALNAKIKDHHIQVEKKYDTRRAYEVDVERFRKAIENIIDNAIEAEAQKITIKVYDVEARLGPATNLDIIDDGQGIDPGITEKIWQPFFGTKNKLQHKGLGLPEALSVARRYGADVKIVSSAYGTTLRVEMDSQNRLANPMEDARSTLESPVENSFVIDQSEADLDIDSILSLDEDEISVESNATENKLDLAQEFTTTQFKVDRRVDILEKPDIDFTKPDKKIDHIPVKVRKPGKA